MKILLTLLTKNKLSGFTLLELLLASFMTFFVVSATGYAIIVMLRESIAGDVSSDLQFNTNRASDFITSEVQQAKSISISSSDAPAACNITGAGEEYVVGLVVGSGTNVNVAYFTKTPPEDPWIGPESSSIYRCGPPLDSDGDVDYTASPSRSILIDSISNSDPVPIPGTCPTGTTQNPSSPSAGFFVCRDDTNTNLVEIHLVAESEALNDRGMTTAGGDGRFDDNANYEVVTKVFARAATP